MSIAVPAVSHPVRFPIGRLAQRALGASVRFWFVVNLAGQLLFAFTIAAFYGATAARGDIGSWNRFMFRGYDPSDPPGNAAVAMHLASAVVMLLAGALQFVPRIRTRFPALHRWSGRTYLVSAFALSAAGVYMHWFRGSFGDFAQHAAGTLNAVLIWACGIAALRAAMARDFAAHRRWAIRLFLVVSGSWFFRAAFFLVLLVFRRPVGFDPNTFTGPLLTFLSFGVYLVPLVLAELYFLAQRSRLAMGQLAMAVALVLLALGTVAGTAGVTGSVWVPALRTAFDGRRSVANALAATLESRGIEAAVAQYRRLAASNPDMWNLDERELNMLGYRLLRSNRVAEAIRIFRLNVEAYPRAANTWDSLGEALLRAGQKEAAISSYRESLRLNPDNGGARLALQKLGAL